MNAKARPAAAKRRVFAGFSRLLRAPFDADGERRRSGKKPVWFRNGGCGGCMPAIVKSGPRQLKIYGESKGPDLLRIFSALSPMQSLAIYRGLLIGISCGIDRNRLGRSGSRDVFSAAHGVLAGAGARAVAAGQDPCIGKTAAGRRLGSCPGRDRGG